MHKNQAPSQASIPAASGKYLALLDPDETGAVRPVSRQEAIDRQLSVYVGRPSIHDLPVRIQGGGFGGIRYTVNGLTPGQLHNQRTQSQQQQEQNHE